MTSSSRTRRWLTGRARLSLVVGKEGKLKRRRSAAGGARVLGRVGRLHQLPDR